MHDGAWADTEEPRKEACGQIRELSVNGIPGSGVSFFFLRDEDSNPGWPICHGESFFWILYHPGNYLTFL